MKTQWDMTGITVHLEGDSMVIITDSTGDTLELTTNLYGDIMDAGSKKILLHRICHTITEAESGR